MAAESGPGCGEAPLDRGRLFIKRLELGEDAPLIGELPAPWVPGSAGRRMATLGDIELQLPPTHASRPNLRPRIRRPFRSAVNARRQVARAARAGQEPGLPGLRV